MIKAIDYIQWLQGCVSNTRCLLGTNVQVYLMASCRLLVAVLFFNFPYLKTLGLTTFFLRIWLGLFPVGQTTSVEYTMTPTPEANGFGKSPVTRTHLLSKSCMQVSEFHSLALRDFQSPSPVRWEVEAWPQGHLLSVDQNMLANHTRETITGEDVFTYTEVLFNSLMKKPPG